MKDVEYESKNLEFDDFEIGHNDLGEELIQNETEEKKKVHLGVLYTILGDKEMKDFDSTYLGNK